MIDDDQLGDLAAPNLLNEDKMPYANTSLLPDLNRYTLTIGEASSLSRIQLLVLIG